MFEEAPLLGEIVANQSSTENESFKRLDKFEEIIELERQHYALKYIQSQYAQPDLSPKQRALAPITTPMHGVDQIGNQFSKKLLPPYLEEDSEIGLANFRIIEANTTDQELALLVNDSQFIDIHSGLKRYLSALSDQMSKDVTERLVPKSGVISKNDLYQFNSNETHRSLNEILKNGINIKVDPDSVNKIIGALAIVGTSPLPITEAVKNSKMLWINGFKDSKVSHAAHDVMDHAWGFNLLRERRLDQKFAGFFDSIGNPEMTDIYKREGEIIASIAFGVRYGSVQENGFIPLISADNIRNIFEEYYNDGVLSERHREAYKILRTMTPNTREYLSLGFTYSNYVAELDEQRRKHGKIKVRDSKDHLITGELSETDPDFLSVFVELHHEILSSKNKHRNDLFRFHILFEEYLQGIANEQISADQGLNIKIQHLDTYDYEGTTVSADRLRWLSKNYGFSATKDALI